MSRGKEQFHCDAEGCDKTRSNDSNHWLLLWDVENFMITVSTWHDATASHDGVHHACGQNCASILFARWLSKKTLENPKENT